MSSRPSMMATFGALRALIPASFAGKTVYSTELEIARVLIGRDHSGPLCSNSCLARNWLAIRLVSRVHS